MKATIKNKPYHLLLLGAALLLLTSFFIIQGHGELKLYDTYLITPMGSFMQFVALILLFIWVLYLLTGRFLHSKQLTWIHVLLTILGAMIFLTLIFNGSSRSVGADGNVLESTGFTLGDSSALGVLMAMAVVLGQLLYFTNLFLGLLRK